MQFINVQTKVKSSRYRWAILFVSFFAFVAFAFAFQLAPPLFPSIISEFGITNAEAGLLMSVVRIPGIFLSLPAGLLVVKYGIRRLGFASLLSVVLGCFLTAVASSFSMLLIGRFIIGLGGGFTIPVAAATVAQWFRSEEMGKAMGIYGINGPVALVIAFPSASFLMSIYGWRFPFFIGAIIGIVAIGIFTIVVRKTPPVASKQKLKVRQALTNLEVWKVGLVWLFYSAAILSFTTWASTLFVAFKATSLVNASLLASMIMWIAIVCNPFYGWLSDRIGRRRLFLLSGSFLMTLSFIALAYTSSLMLIVCVIMLGLTSASMYPVMSALPAEILGPSLASIGFGITGLCNNIGVAFSQPLIGFVLDITGSYDFSLLAMATLSAIGTFFAYTLIKRK